MPAGRPKKVPPRYLPLWVQVKPDVIRELDTLAAEIAQRIGSGVTITRQDAARSVLDGWIVQRAQRVARRERGKNGTTGKRAPAA